MSHRNTYVTWVPFFSPVLEDSSEMILARKLPDRLLSILSPVCTIKINPNHSMMIDVFMLAGDTEGEFSVHHHKHYIECTYQVWLRIWSIFLLTFTPLDQRLEFFKLLFCLTHFAPKSKLVAIYNWQDFVLRRLHLPLLCPLCASSGNRMGNFTGWLHHGAGF
jgi:hypothetical protein